jgi:hypothetical protein
MQDQYQDTAYSDTIIPQGFSLISKSANYYARVQADGNFAVYVSSHFVKDNVQFIDNL